MSSRNKPNTYSKGMQWTCDVCSSAQYPTYEEALTHEVECREEARRAVERQERQDDGSTDVQNQQDEEQEGRTAGWQDLSQDTVILIASFLDVGDRTLKSVCLVVGNDVAAHIRRAYLKHNEAFLQYALTVAVRAIPWAETETGEPFVLPQLVSAMIRNWMEANSHWPDLVHGVSTQIPAFMQRVTTYPKAGRIIQPDSPYVDTDFARFIRFKRGRGHQILFAGFNYLPPTGLVRRFQNVKEGDVLVSMKGKSKLFKAHMKINKRKGKRQHSDGFATLDEMYKVLRDYRRHGINEFLFTKQALFWPLAHPITAVRLGLVEVLAVMVERYVVGVNDKFSQPVVRRNTVAPLFYGPGKSEQISLLQWVLKLSDPSCLLFLLSRTELEIGEEPLLHLVARLNCSYEVFKIALNRPRTYVNREYNDKTPLYVLCEKFLTAKPGHQDLIIRKVELLIEAGADPRVGRNSLYVIRTTLDEDTTTHSTRASGQRKKRLIKILEDAERFHYERIATILSEQRRAKRMKRDPSGVLV